MANSEDEKKDSQLKLWEVFVQLEGGEPHSHAGSIHASDKEMALQNARDVYARREKVVNIWVVLSEHMFASEVKDRGSLFEPSDDKIYRYPQFYKSPRGVSMF